ncbi:MAG: hypothetical protein RI885_1328 [Actinomycetota bacterium]|jgi:protein-tyrosine phosphatase
MPAILIVCSANVCRSVLAAAALSELLPGGAQAIDVSSAGVRARPGMPPCSRILTSSTLDGSAADLRATHRSRVVTPQAIDAADLILTAEAAHRATICSVSPEARSKTFTLLEAVALADVVRRSEGWAPRAALAEWVQVLDGARGRIPTPLRAPWWRHRAPSEELDISDGHVEGRRQHARTIATIETAVGRLVGALPDLADPAH